MSCFDAARLIIFQPMICNSSSAHCRIYQNEKKKAIHANTLGAKKAGELCVIMCRSNNPVRYVSQESMNTKEAPALISRVVEIQGYSPLENFNIQDLVILA